MCVVSCIFAGAACEHMLNVTCTRRCKMAVEVVDDAWRLSYGGVGSVVQTKWKRDKGSTHVICRNLQFCMCGLCKYSMHRYKITKEVVVGEKDIKRDNMACNRLNKRNIIGRIVLVAED